MAASAIGRRVATGLPGAFVLEALAGALAQQHHREDRRRATWQRIQRDETRVSAAVCEHLWRNLQRVRIDTNIDFGAAVVPELKDVGSDHAVACIRHS